MKTVYSNAELPHLWANRRQHAARNANDTISFNGSSYYSYATTIAKRLQSGTVVMSLRDYSVTTSRHQGDLRRALHGEVVFCHDLNYKPDENYQYMAREVAAFWKRQQRALKIDYLAQARAKIESFKRYAAAVGYKMPADTVEDIVKATEKERKKAEAARKKAEAARKKAEAKFKKGINWDVIARAYNVARRAFHAGHIRAHNRIARRLRDFRNECGRYGVSIPDYLYDEDFLRVIDGGVITTRGVNIRTGEARAFFELLKSGTNPAGRAVAGYTVKQWDDTRAVVGCHIFPRDEITYISRELFGEGV